MELFMAKRFWLKADAPGARLFRGSPEEVDIVETTARDGVASSYWTCTSVGMFQPFAANRSDVRGRRCDVMQASCLLSRMTLHVGAT